VANRPSACSGLGLAFKERRSANARAPAAVRSNFRNRNYLKYVLQHNKRYVPLRDGR
jgi:hypothetical protein